MRERPIAFSPAMVRAILDGRKSQTRRVMKRQLGNAKLDPLVGRSAFTPDGMVSVRGKSEDGEFGEWFLKPPYGITGDHLWVREPWVVGRGYDRISPADADRAASMGHRLNKGRIHLHYLADGPAPGWAGRYRHGRFMCRWMARIVLEVTDVRVQRLQDISEGDARSEGFSSEPTLGTLVRNGKSEPATIAVFNPRLWFASLWTSINGPDSWKVNPWVWVVSFRRIK